CQLILARTLRLRWYRWRRRWWRRRGLRGLGRLRRGCVLAEFEDILHQRFDFLIAVLAHNGTHTGSLDPFADDLLDVLRGVAVPPHVIREVQLLHGPFSVGLVAHLAAGFVDFLADLEILFLADDLFLCPFPLFFGFRLVLFL